MESRSLVALLLLFFAHLTADLVTVGLAPRLDPVVHLTFQALLFSQLGLLGVWIGLGGTRWPVKAIVATFVIVDLSILLSLSQMPIQPTVLLIGAYGLFLLPFALLPAGALWSIRRRGTKLAWELSSGEEPTRARFQFSLRWLLGLILVAAVLLGTCRLEQPPWLAPTVVEIACITAIVLTSTWVAFCGLAWPIRLITGALCGVPLGLFFGWLVGPLFYWEMHHAGVFGGLLSLLVVGSLVFLQWRGYRLVTQARQAASSCPGGHGAEAAGHSDPGL